MKISGSATSYSLAQVQHLPGDDVEERQPAAHAEQRLGAVHAHRRPETAVELDHDRLRDRGGGVLVGDLGVGERVHVERLDRRLGDHARSRRARGAGSSGRTSRWRPRPRRRRPSSPARGSNLDYPYLDRRLAGRESSATAREDGAAGPGAARPGAGLPWPIWPAPPTRCVATCSPSPPYAGRRPWRRTSRSDASPAPRCCSMPWRDAGQAGASCRCCCPTSTSTGRCTPAATSLAPGRLRAARTDRSASGRRGGRHRRRRPRARARRLRRRPPARPGRRLLRPGAGPGPGRHRSPACCCTTARSASTYPSNPTTGRSSPPSPRRRCGPPATLSGAEAPLDRAEPNSTVAEAQLNLHRGRGPGSGCPSAAASTASRLKAQGRVSPSTHRSVWSV